MGVRNNIGLMGLILVLLNLSSFVFTGIGIIAINEDIPPYLGYFGSGLIQGVIATTSIRLLPGQGPLLGLVFIYPMYLVAMFLSVSFSGSAVLQGTMGKSLSIQTQQENIDKVTTQATDLLDSAKEMEKQFFALSQFSKDKAQVEEDKGGTCWYRNKKNKLVATPYGPGPRQRKRIYQSDVFNQMSKEVSDGSKNLEKIIKELTGMNSVIENELKREVDGESDKEKDLRIRKAVKSALRDVKNKYRQVEFQYNSLNILVKQHKKVLKVHSDAEFGGFLDKLEYHGFSGESSACNDTQTKRKIDFLLSSSLATLKDLDLKAIDPTNRSQFFDINAGLLWDLVSGKQTFDNLREDKDKKEYIKPLLTGMLIDFFILFLAITIQISKGNTYRAYLIKHYSVDSLASIANKMFPIIKAYKDEFDFLKNINNTNFEKTSVGYSAQTLKHVVNSLSVVIDRENYLFQPREHAGDRQVRSTRAKHFVELQKAVISVLHKYRFIGSKDAQMVNEYRGNDLNNIIHQVGLTAEDIGPNGAFNVYHIHPDFYSMLDEFNNNNTFAEVGEQEDWRRFLPFIPTNHAYGEIMSLLAGRDQVELARFVHRRARKAIINRAKNWQVVLNLHDAMEKDVWEWLRDDDHGLASNVDEVPPSLILGISLFPYKATFNLTEAGWQKIQRLVDTVDV